MGGAGSGRCGRLRMSNGGKMGLRLRELGERHVLSLDLVGELDSAGEWRGPVGRMLRGISSLLRVEWSWLCSRTEEGAALCWTFFGCLVEESCVMVVDIA